MTSPKHFAFSLAVSAVLSLPALSGCTKAGTGADLPLVTPPVKAAAPAGFQTRGGRALDSADIRSRFFTTGPTSVFAILTAIDDRISGINTQAATSTAACLSQTPVAYTITPWGQTVTMYGQCYQNVGTPTAADPSLVQWGKKDGVTYLYTAVGASRVAVIATPITGTSNYTVQAWMGVGYTNSTCGAGSWDTCSYGVIQLEANSNTSTFEMVVAGMGFGYCGAQLKSDGTSVYLTGSTDMGTTCNAIDTACVSSANISNAGTCGSTLTTFSLAALGRKTATGTNTGTVPIATWAATQYPSTPGTVTLNGTATDDLYFGPLTATTGVGAF